MKNKIDNILSATLWLLICILATCFWFNVRFGFNVLSRTHWHHLAYMQASNTPITPYFYISLICVTVITIIGLYIIVRPKFRKIQLKTRKLEQEIKTKTYKTAPTPTTPVTAPQPTPQPAPQPAQIPETNITRPPRLININTPVQMSQFIPTAPIVTPTQDVTESAPPLPPPTPSATPELIQIFEEADYEIKKAPRIKGLQTALFAIGTSETIWIGATDVPTSMLDQAVQALDQVFTDTLEDIDIAINAFVINATDASAPEASNILTFDSIDSLRNYMTEHINPKPVEDDVENFEAFSSYINTVLDYIGKV